jgi:drug/metabolite transporter (DMT)-like permease
MGDNGAIAAPLDRFLANQPLVLAVLLLVDSLHLIFARLLTPYLPPVTAALYVLGVAFLQIALFMGWRGMIRIAVLQAHLLFFLVIGFLVALATTLSYAAVHWVDPGTASLVSKTYTLFALGLGYFWLRERFHWRAWAGTAVAVAGTFVISYQPSDLLQVGTLLILGSNFAYALHAAVTKRYGDEIEFANFFLFRVGSTTLFLFLFMAGQAGWAWPGWQAWLILLIAGSIDVVLSRILYYLALRRLQMSLHAIILTLTPVITILWSWLLFDTLPTMQSGLGGAAVIAGVLIVTTSRQQRRQIVAAPSKNRNH